MFEVAKPSGTRGATHPSSNCDVERTTLLRPSTPRGDCTWAASAPRLRSSAAPPRRTPSSQTQLKAGRRL
eukprot:1155347-Prymnesium_polylepis.1